VSEFREHGVASGSPPAQQALARYATIFDERLSVLARTLVSFTIPIVAVMNVFLHFRRGRSWRCCC
jgi:hypothetical protein